MAAEVQDRRLEEHEVLAIARFRFALRRFEQTTDAIIRKCGLTPQRYLLLLAVCSGSADGGTATVSGIGRDLQMPQTTVTDLVARAVDVGLLEKAAVADDGRIARISLTAEGHARLTRTVRRLQRERTDLRQALIEALQAYPD
jgi:DNA-binding MarR family transcriptional regulator